MSDLAPTALSDLRILDLTDIKGALCGKLFGDMGADVIKIEPPDGDPMRSVGPFLTTGRIVTAVCSIGSTIRANGE